MSILNVDKIQPIGGGSTITVDATHVDILDNIRHVGDTNTKIRFPSADTITAETSGSERLRIQSDGNVAVGTNAVSAGDLATGTTIGLPKLHVDCGHLGNGAYHIARFRAGTDADWNAAVLTINQSNDRGLAIYGGRSTGDRSWGAIKSIDNIGRVSNAIEIIGDEGQGVQDIKLYTGDATTTTERLKITSTGNVDINGAPPWTVTGGNWRNLSISGEGAAGSGFLWLGNGAAATNADFDLGRINYCNGATITSSIRASTQTGANDDGRITFHTKATGGSLTEKVRITSAGKVGINETSPQDGLHVHEDTIYRGIFVNGNTAPRIAFARNTTTTGEWSVGVDGTNGNQFAINNSDGNSNRKLIISSSQISLLSNTSVSGDFVFGANAKAKLFENGVQSGVQATNSGSSAHLMTHDGAEDIHVDPSGYMKFEVAGLERLRINSSGNVSIGNNPTLASDTLLHVEKAGETNVIFEGDTTTLGARLTLKNNNTAAGALNQIDFADAGGQSTSTIKGFNTDQSNNYGDLSFCTRDAPGSAPAESLRISSRGKVSCTKHEDTAVYGASNWANTGSGNRSNASQASPEGSFQWQSTTGNGNEKFKSYIQSTSANQADMYIHLVNSSFYRITITGKHNSQSANVAMYLVYGLNNTAARIQQVTSSGGFTVTAHNTHVNSHDTTIKINYSGSLNQGMRALVEQIGGF